MGQAKTAKHVIVISLDAVGSRDFEELRKMPGFGAFLERGSYSCNVRSVYPSLTYPAHATIVTGRYPKSHGIVNNTRLQLSMDKPDWFWQRRFIKGTTLYEEAARHNKRTAALLWPVTGKAKIRYHFPEVLPNRPWQNQITAVLKNGTPAYELMLEKRFGHLRKGIAQPYLDNFVHQCLLYTVKKYKPELMLVHWTDVDTNRHLYGTEAPEVKAALKRHDDRLSELIQLLKEQGMYEDTAVILLGDHSQLDVHTALYPNYFFRKKGLLTINKGRIRDFKAYAKNCDGSCYIYVKKGLGKAERSQVVNAVREFKKAFPEGVERLYSRSQAEAMGADGACACMLEAREGYYFLDEWEEPFTRVDMESQKPHMMLGSHGFHPDKKGYQTVFMAAGAGIKKGEIINQMSLLDEGPTIARLMGFSLPQAEGQVITRILEMENTDEG